MQPMSYNLWLYVYANPVMFTDPSGMFALTPRDTHPSLDGYSRFTTDPLSIEEELNIALGCSPLYTSLLQNYYYRSPSPYRYSMSQMFGQPQGGGQSSTQNPWDTMLRWGLNGAAMLPGLETVDDALTAFTGCGIACQLGYDEKVGWGWRGVAAVSLFAPIGVSVLRNADNVGDVFKAVNRVDDPAENIVYRVMRHEEPDPLLYGITAKNIFGEYSEQIHVMKGNKLKTQFISTTKDINWAMMWAVKDSKRVSIIDLGKVDPDTIIDLTKPGAMQGWNPVAIAWASRAREVLVERHIPIDAILDVLYP